MFTSHLITSQEALYLALNKISVVSVLTHALLALLLLLGVDLETSHIWPSSIIGYSFVLHTVLVSFQTTSLGI